MYNAHNGRNVYIALEMYVSGVLAAVFLLLFFLGIKKSQCPFYYKWIGKNAAFYIYILHMAVSVVLGKLYSFSSLTVKIPLVLIVSFIIYEIGYLASLFIKKTRSLKGGEMTNVK